MRLFPLRGQSMLEAIIATGIIVTAVSSALTLVAGSVKASKESETSITAANLAREGLEVARAIRDSNWLAGRPFDDGLHDGTDYAGIATFDPATNAWIMDYASANLASDAPARLYRYVTPSGKAVAGLFVQTPTPPVGAVPTLFSRIVVTEPICDDGAGGTTIAAAGTDCGVHPKIGIHVVSEVRWIIGGGRARVLSAEERMMDWR